MNDERAALNLCPQLSIKGIHETIRFFEQRKVWPIAEIVAEYVRLERELRRAVWTVYHKQSISVIRRAARCIAAGQRWRGSNTR